MLSICFVACSLLFVAFPGIDLAVSRVFFDGSFQASAYPVVRMLHDGLGYVLALTLTLLVLLCVFNAATRRRHLDVDARVLAYLLLVLAIGAGIIVNFALKDQFGRARPRDVAEFGGLRAFTPAFVMTDQCTTNCSFSSGEGAGAFFAIALARVLSRRRRMLVAAVGVGIVVSLARVAAGAHFLSDIVTSFFVMLLVSEILYLWVLEPRRALARLAT